MPNLVFSTHSGWSAKLSHSITLKDGTTLTTLAGARAFILREPAHIQERQSWQRAAELMMAAAEGGHGTEDATKQIELALFLEARWVLPHLRRILKSYARYYNETRTHRSLDKGAPISRPVQRTGGIISHALLGGLHHHYVRV